MQGPRELSAKRARDGVHPRRDCLSDPPLLVRMPNGFPVPPIPPTPPSFLLNKPLSATSPPLPTMTPLPPPPVPPVAPQAESEPERAPPSSVTGENRSGGQLRRVILPAKLISHFIDVIAEANTARKIETCGLLLGKERDDELVISHLLIPQQSGSSETCSMQREEEVAAFQQQESLLTLGWIHTHPTQSIFLSSLDLHTHASYHPQLPLYTDVDQEGGHCLVREESFQCVDLR
ncbi:Mov34-domain-containing protein [Rhodotorula sp. JG-1b]|nr:Mov34-domain-containing protein [Rhodotorula sp. JG-1b]